MRISFLEVLQWKLQKILLIRFSPVSHTVCLIYFVTLGSPGVVGSSSKSAEESQVIHCWEPSLHCCPVCESQFCANKSYKSKNGDMILACLQSLDRARICFRSC